MSEAQNIRALLVEDDEEDAAIFCRYVRRLREQEVYVEHVASEDEGWTRLSDEQFDLIFIDLNLGIGGSGINLLRRLRADKVDIPAIIVTGSGDEMKAVEAMKSGAYDYLVKENLNPDLLDRSLRYAIDRKRTQAALKIKDRAIESSINPIAIADLKGNLTHVNPSFVKLCGYDVDKEVLGRHATEFCSMGPEALKVARALRSRGSWIGKIGGLRKDGSLLDLQLSASLVKDELGRALCMVFSFVDITELTQLRRRLKTEQSFAGIVGRDVKMLQLFDTIKELADVSAPVLIQGESGTGKELVAAAIHNEGPRADKPFVPVNCSALPEGVLESELFGHVRGAFTGAFRDRKGRFELADRGTVFLDEIGDLPPVVQVKLLRVLQEGTFERVGSEQTIKVDLRVVSATNKDIQQEVGAGRFREDLFYRLCVVPLHLPPLRERRNDIPLLASHILSKALAEAARKDVALSQEALEAMIDYDWPGNVRELENAIMYALVKCRGDLLQFEHLPVRLCEERTLRTEQSAKRQKKRKLNAESVRKALQETDGNKAKAAQRLGVARATLYRFLDESRMLRKEGEQ